MRDDWIEFAGAQVPRYTSYPTAVDFGASVGADDVCDWLADMPDSAPLSVYVHIPFCRKLCWYCGCTTSVPNGYDRIASYFDVLLQEIDLWAERAGRARLTHLHFGGGTPNALSPADFTRLFRYLKQAFNVDPDHEFSVELDPRILNDAMIEVMAASGVTRASLGIQTLSPVVQSAINRIQPKPDITRTVAHLRRAGIKALNADLMYGLPRQTVSDIEDAAQYCADIGVDRVSVFGYAHVPWFAKHQRAIRESDLPGLPERMLQAEAAEGVLQAAGYKSIGFDHYARPGDWLAQAAKNGCLRRNFQGYTDDTSPYLIGIGQTSISRFPEGYGQSHKGLLDWRASVTTGRLPIARGVSLTNDDRMRAHAIEHLLCNLSVDLGQIARQFGATPGVFGDAMEGLKMLETRGLCRLKGMRVSIPQEVKLLIRNVAATLDARLVQTAERHAIAG